MLHKQHLMLKNIIVAMTIIKVIIIVLDIINTDETKYGGIGHVLYNFIKYWTKLFAYFKLHMYVSSKVILLYKTWTSLS